MYIENNSLPNFFILGAQKSATSTVHEWLLQHKEISLPIIKETHFFSDIEKYQKGLNWYLNKFDKRNNFKGEIDPSYLYVEQSILRIKEVYKDFPLKFIILLRKPIERAFSHYLMSKYKGYEDLPFIDAIKAEKKRLLSSANNKKYTLTKDLSVFSYIDRGNYFSQIKYLKNIFPESEILYIKFDDIVANNKKTYRKICRFLNITPFKNIDLNVNSNSSSEPKIKIVRNMIYNDSFLKKTFNFLVTNEDVRQYIKKYIDNKNKKPISSDSKRIELSSYINELPDIYRSWNNNEVVNLEKLIKLDLNKWIID